MARNPEQSPENGNAPYVTEQNVSFETMRSSGPGGQKTNKSETAVRLRVAIDDLPLTDAQKEIVREHLAPAYHVGDGELMVENSDERKQKDNKKNALKVANELIAEALEAGRQAQQREEHKKRFKRRKRRGGGSSKGPSRREIEKKRTRSTTTREWLEQADRERLDDEER